VADITPIIRSGRVVFLDLQRAGQRDVAVEMTLVEFVEQNAGHAGQRGVGQHLAQQDALGHIADAGAGPGHIFEADLVADVVAEGDTAFLGHPGGQQAGGDAAGLQDNHGAAPRTPWSSRICGTWVDLPEPVGAWMTTRLRWGRAAAMAGAMS
jgi:hypothetical protein